MKQFTINEFGVSVHDVDKIVAFVPSLKQPDDIQRFGLVVSFTKPYDREKIRIGAEKVLSELYSKKVSPRVIAIDDRSILILVGLGEEFAKPQPFHADASLSTTLKEASTGKHTAVIAATLDNLPDDLRRDDLPRQVRPYQPLTQAQTVSGYLDLGKSIDLDVRIKTTTNAQAIDCEKSLGALATLLQEALGDEVKSLEADAAKRMRLKDLVAIMKAVISSAKNARFSTSGNETRVTASLSTDLPFTNAFLMAVAQLRGNAGGSQSANNLKQIALAMHLYHDTNNALPPAAVCDKTGKPLLSWRVLILPYIEQQELYKQFKLDEPWDSVNNKKLLAKMPKVYALPEKNKEGDTDTYYQVFVGNGAGFDSLTGTRLTQITDGTSNTLMAITAAKAVPWTKPDDLEFDPDQDMTKLVGFYVNGNAQAAYFDGSVRSLTPKQLSRKNLDALITRSGGEVIDIDR